MSRVCLLPGDGIGPEVIESARQALTVLLPEIEFTDAAIGFGAYQQFGSPLPDETLCEIREADAALLGAVTTPPNIPGYFSPIVRMRQSLELYANLRPCASIEHPRSVQGINFMLFRENTEGMYSGIERISEDGERAVTERVITRKASERIVRKAFQYAREQGRSTVHVIHKANVLRQTCGLFLSTARRVSEEFPEIERKELIVDACAMEIVRAPQQFEVIVTTNLFGDILSDEASMFVGGLGTAASANIGDNASVFEPVHGSAPDIAGKDIANPIATLLATVMMLRHINQNQAADHLQNAIHACIRGNFTTPDLGGVLTTEQVTHAVIEHLTKLA